MESTQTESALPVLSMKGVQKRFSGVHALKGVDIAVMPGEIVALIGENGAGKSTLMKVLGGVHQPDGGTIEVGALVSTLMACSDMDTWLAMMTSVVVDGDTLVVYKGTEKIGTLARA